MLRRLKLHLLQEHFSEDTYDVHETTTSEQGPALTISVGNKQQALTLVELRQMPAVAFSSLWSVS